MPKADLPKSLNICLIANKFPILGRAADHGFLWPIARGLAAQNHNVTVLAWRNPQGKKEIVQDNVQAYFLGHGSELLSEKFPELALKKFSEIHAKTPFHIVHSIDDNGRLIGLHRKQFKVAMTYDVEATHMSEIFSILGLAQESIFGMLKTSLKVASRFLFTYFGHDRGILKTADGMFVTSPKQRIALERHYLYPDYHTYTVPYGLDIGDLSPRERSDETLKRLGIPSSAQVVMTVTDMSELSELQNLLYAFEKLAIKKPSSRLVIVGDGPLRKQVEFEALNLALGSRVIFTGAVKNAEIPELIAMADIYVNLNSRTSGFEPSMLEAMAQNKIIIGSEVSPIATIVENGKDGFLIRPADYESLATLLIQIFNGQLQVDSIASSGRQKVMKIFDTQEMVHQTLRAYYQTLASTRHYNSNSLDNLDLSLTASTQ